MKILSVSKEENQARIQFNMQIHNPFYEAFEP